MTTTLWDSTQLAEYLGVSKDYVKYLRKNTDLPAVKLSKRVLRFRPDSIDAWLAKQEQH